MILCLQKLMMCWYPVEKCQSEAARSRTRRKRRKVEEKGGEERGREKLTLRHCSKEPSMAASFVT